MKTWPWPITIPKGDWLPLELWKYKLTQVDWAAVDDAQFYGWIAVCEHTGPNGPGGPRGDGRGAGRGRGYHFGPGVYAGPSIYDGAPTRAARWSCSCTCLGVCQTCATFCSSDCPPPTCRLELLSALMYANHTFWPWHQKVEAETKIAIAQAIARGECRR